MMAGDYYEVGLIPFRMSGGKEVRHRGKLPTSIPCNLEPGSFCVI